MFSDLAFFSFVQLDDDSLHGAYNRWHQLDHRPENLALPGVAWGDRWARVRDPVEHSVDAWDRLGEASFQWGRGPIIPGVERKLLAFFRPVKGYSAPHALVSPYVLPFRPNQGMHITLTRYPEPHGLDAHDSFRWEDTELMPELLKVPGVAGGWTFSFSHAQKHSTLPFADTVSHQPGELRIRLLYLDGEPESTGAAIRGAEQQLAAEPSVPKAGEVLFSSTLSTIVPWRDW